jgi:hypothetical protein
MPFWTNAAPGTQDPKRNYRWIMLNGSIPQWVCKKVSKPSYEVSEAEHKYINHTFYYPGRIKWKEIKLTLTDGLQPDAVATMMAILQSSGYHPPSNPDDTSTISKSRAVNSLGDVEIHQIDENGRWIERWKLVNAWVKDAAFGELDYENDELISIEITLRYDFAVMETRNPSAPISDGVSPPHVGTHFPSNWRI